MNFNLKDTDQSWELGMDGEYSRIREGGERFNVHNAFMAPPSLLAQSGAERAKLRAIP